MKLRNVSIFVTPNWQTIFHTKHMGTFMNYIRTQISQTSLNAGITPKTKEILRNAVMLVLCTNQNQHDKLQILPEIPKYSISVPRRNDASVSLST
jgi:hypothetical protein